MSRYPKVGGSTQDNAHSRAGGVFRRALRRLTATNEELADADLQRSVRETGATPIGECADRERVDLCGDISAVTVNPDADKPALEVELKDGSGVVTLIWLGRRRIPGLEPGRRIRVSGRISCQQGGRRVMFNPRYELS